MSFKDKLVLLLVGSSILGPAISLGNFYLYHVLMIILATSIIIDFMRKKIDFKQLILPTKLHGFFAIMISWYALTLIWSYDKMQSAIYLVYIIIGSFLSISIIYYVGDNKKKLQLVFKAIVGVFVFVLIVSFLESMTGVPILRIPMSSSHSKSSSFYGNINNLSTVLVMILPYFLFQKKLIIKYLGLVTITTIIVVGSSRTNLITIVFMFFIYIIIFGRKISKKLIVKELLVILVVLFSFFLFKTIKGTETNVVQAVKYSFRSLGKFVSSDGADLDNSIGIRRRLIINGLDGLKESRGLGVGGGASKYLQLDKGTTYGIIDMHNFWVEVLVEAGVMFFVVFSYWYINLITKMHFYSKKHKDEELEYYSMSTSLALLSFVPAAVSPSSTIYLLPMWLLFGFSVAVINVYTKELRYGK